MVEEAADTKESVLRVGVFRVAAGLIAPHNKVAGADEGRHALLIQHIALLLIHQDFGAIFQAGGGNGYADIGRAGIRRVVVQAVVVDCRSSGQRATAVDGAADLAVQPQAICFTRSCALLDLLVCHVGVLACTGSGTVDVNKAHCIENAIDLAALCLERCAHHGILGEAGCQQNAGNHAQLGEHLSYHFQSGLCTGGRIHAAHDVGSGDFGRVKNGTGNGQGRCAVAFAAVDQGDAHSAIIIEAGRIVLVRREHGLLLLHDQLFQQDAGLVDLCNAVIHLNGLVGQFSDVLCIRRIQDVDHDDRGNAHHLKTGAHRLTQGILCKIVGIAHCGGSFFEGIHQHRRIHRCFRVIQHINGGRTHNDLQAGVDRYRSGDAGRCFGLVKAMRNSHLSYPPYFIRSVAFL